MNRDLTVKWAEAASALSGVVREQVPAESVADVVREQGSTAEQACGVRERGYSLWVPEIGVTRT